MIVRGLVALVTMFGFVPSASAFELSRTSTGAEIYVATFPIPYDVTDDDVIAGAARRAFDTWARTSGGVIVPSYRGRTTAAIERDGTSTIALLDPWDTSFGEVSRTVAHTEVFYDVATGITAESDIFLNAERFGFGDPAPGVFDAEGVILHELGHLLGLAHTCGDPGRTYDSCFDVPDDPPGRRLEILEAAMAPTLSTSTIRRVPNADDRRAIAVHYGGQADTRVPIVTTVLRDCAADPPVAVIDGADLDASDVTMVRREDGTTAPLTATWIDGAWIIADAAALDDAADIVVANPVTGAYGSLVQFDPLEVCPMPKPANPDPMEGGCTCSASSRANDRAEMWLVLMLGLLCGRQRGRRFAMLNEEGRS